MAALHKGLVSGQARLAVLATTHGYKRTHCLWLEQFQIADSARLTATGHRGEIARRLTGYAPGIGSSGRPVGWADAGLLGRHASGKSVLFVSLAWCELV